jgi:hypothetical protein
LTQGENTTGKQDRQGMGGSREGAGRLETSPAEAEGQAVDGKGRKNTNPPFLSLVNLLKALALCAAVRKQVLSAPSRKPNFPLGYFPTPQGTSNRGPS